MADATKKSLLSRFGSGIKQAGKMAMDAYLNPAGTGAGVGGRVGSTIRGVLKRSMKSKPMSFDNPKAAPAKRATGSRFVRTDA